MEITLNLNINLKSEGIDELKKNFGQLLAINHELLEKVKTMSQALDDLTEKVKNLETVEESAIALLQGLKAKLDEAIASGDPAALQALSDRLGTDTQSLADAVMANTPAE